MNMKSCIVLDMTPCSLVEVRRHMFEIREASKLTQLSASFLLIAYLPYFNPEDGRSYFL
jgi:hypothetical protein